MFLRLASGCTAPPWPDERCRRALEAHDRLDQIGPGVGAQPPERAAGRMRLDDRRADLVEQHAAPALPQLHHRGVVGRRRVRRRHPLIEQRIARQARARPAPRRAGGPAPQLAGHEVVGRHRANRAGGIGMVRHASMTGPIDEVHLVAGLHVVVRPAGVAVEAHVIGALAAAAVHEHDRQRLADLLGDQVLDVDLPGDDGAVVHLLGLGADPEVAHVRQAQRRGVGAALLVGGRAAGRRSCPASSGSAAAPRGCSSPPSSCGCCRAGPRRVRCAALRPSRRPASGTPPDRDCRARRWRPAP